MSFAIAPWLRPTDVLGSMQAGSQVGLGIRAAVERERAARAEEAMQADRAAQQAQEAQAQSLYRYDALREANERYMREEALKRELAASENKFREKSALDTANYRTGVLQNQRDRNATSKIDKTLELENTRGLADEVSKGVSVLDALKKFPFADRSLVAPLMQDWMLGQREKVAQSKAAAADDKVSTSYKIPAVEEVEARPSRMFGLLSERKAVEGRPEITVHDKVSRDEIKKLTAPPAEEKVVTPDLAREFIKAAGGDKQKARALAKEAGYSF